MATTRSTARSRAAEGTTPRPAAGGRGLETGLLLLASTVVAAGLVLVTLARIAVPGPGNTGTGAVDLNRIDKAEDLLPYLGFLTSANDRNFAARVLYRHLQDRGASGVGELGAVRVGVAQVARNRSLSVYAERLRELRLQNAKSDPESMPLFTAAEVRRLRPFFVVRTQQEFLRTTTIWALVLLAGFYAVHLAWRAARFAGDPILLPLVHLLSGVGGILMISLRDPLRDRLLFPDFAAGVGVGCVLLFLCSRPDYARTPLRRLAYVPLLGSFALSLVVLVFGSGPGVSDAKVNFRLGPFSTQPVELIKLLLVLFLAGYFADRWELFRELQEPKRNLPGALRRFELPRLRYALPVLVGVAAAIVFFFLQKDLGPALVCTLLFLTLWAVARGRAVALGAGFAALLGAFWVGYALGFPRTVAGRVSVWLSPWDNYVRPGGDHVAQSLWTFAAGGLFGTGLGLGDASTVPAVHTDVILAAAAEELGFLGLAGIFAAYAVFVHRALRISLGARGPYALFLGLGLTLLAALQIAIISAGILGLAPLSGVATPFLSYGKSAMIVNFMIVGILAGLSAHPGAPEENAPFRVPARWVGGVLATVGALVLLQAARVQVWRADETLGAGALVIQADGHRRFTYNPRILEAAALIERGVIVDRNGVPLAASSIAALEPRRADYQQLGVDLDRALDRGARRHYPFGALLFHVLGDARTRENWGAPNTAFVERDLNARLQGYDDRPALVEVRDAPGGSKHVELRRNFRELVPLVRYRHVAGHPDVERILRRDRNVRLTLDIRLQKQAHEILARHVTAAGRQRGAAVVIDPDTGDLLALVSLPLPTPGDDEGSAANGAGEARDPGLLDRVRFGLYPPGSSFKLVTAAAALQAKPGVESEVFTCRRLPDGRVGNYVRGWGKPIRDDVLDTAPHGEVDLARGLTLSCNAYFAQLGTYTVGAETLLRTAQLFGIRVAAPNTPQGLKDALPQASYGQGQVVASPLQMARVAAAIATGGRSVATRVDAAEQASEQQFLKPETALLLARTMRDVVTQGTARSISALPLPIAGKTGTAELANHPSHAWFVGFAPYRAGATKRIAFAVLVENGRYGGRVAAPAAGEIATAAAALRLIE